MNRRHSINLLIILIVLLSIGIAFLSSCQTRENQKSPVQLVIEGWDGKFPFVTDYGDYCNCAMQTISRGFVLDISARVYGSLPTEVDYVVIKKFLEEVLVNDTVVARNEEDWNQVVEVGGMLKIYCYSLSLVAGYAATHSGLNSVDYRVTLSGEDSMGNDVTTTAIFDVTIESGTLDDTICGYIMD